MSDRKPPVWEREPERYIEKTKIRIEWHSVKDPVRGCWIWTAACSYRSGRPKDQAGQQRPAMSFRGRTRYVSRVAYELWVGPVPDGREIDHICGDRACVRPDHLQAITHRENLRRYQRQLRLAREQAMQRHPAFSQKPVEGRCEVPDRHTLEPCGMPAISKTSPVCAAHRWTLSAGAGN